MRMAPPIVLTAEQEKALTKLARSSTTSVRLAHRARIAGSRGQSRMALT